MSCGKKAAAQIALLITGITMLCFGVWRGEAATVLSKAIKLCLECVALGKSFRRFTDHVPFPGLDPAGATLLTNLHLRTFSRADCIRGGEDRLRAGLNCYSCPAASGACPIGRFRRWWGLPSSASPTISQASSFC